MAFALPGIRRQVDRRSFPGEERLQVEVAAAGNDLSSRGPDLFGIVSAARGGAEHTAVHVCGLERVVQVRTQQRVRADLDKNVVAFGRQPVGGLFEAHRFAHVAPPVVGGQRSAVQRRAGDGGIEGDVGRARLNAGQRFADARFDGIHCGAVELSLIHI